MKHLVSTAIILSLLSAPVMAAPYDNKPGHGPEQKQPAAQGHQDKKEKKVNAPAPRSRHYYSYQGKKYDSRKGPKWQAPKGHNPHIVWSRGDRLPEVYRASPYVLDYRTYHLNRPPRGYEWVRYQNDVLLVAISNGHISDIVFNLFY